MTNNFCIWHKHLNKVAVNLGGTPLQGFKNKGDAVEIMSLIHPNIREQVEIRNLGEIKVNSFMN